MKAVILAAGRGTRIHAVTNGSPKCLLRFGDRTILDYQLDSLFQAGVREIAIVLGYRAREIIDHVARRPPAELRGIEFLINEKFAATNNMYSLWQARAWLGNAGFVCINADVLYHPNVLVPALRSRSDISVLIDREFREETTKVIVRGGRVLALSKSISPAEFSGTFVNIASFSARGARDLFAKSACLVANGEVNCFFNDVVGMLICDGVDVGFADVSGLPWAEIDDPGDLQFARAAVYPRLALAVSPIATEEREEVLSSVA